MRSAEQPETVWMALGHLLVRGVLWGGAASVVGAGLGILFLKPGLPGALAGLNIAGILLCVLAGSFIYGTGKVQQVDSYNQARLGHASARFTLPFGQVLVALIAAGICFLLMWLGGLLR